MTSRVNEISRKEKMMGEGVKFERVRRVTGYLSPLNRFNDAKQAEEVARVKHITSSNMD